MLDLLTELFTKARLLSPRHRRTLAIDSTCFERHHRSIHYDRRCRRMALADAKRPGKWRESVNAARGVNLRRLRKLALAVEGGCHLILAARTHIGNGSDPPDFAPLLQQASRRARVSVVVADAGYDAEHNHRLAREKMGVRSLIPPGIGRPTSKPPSGR